MRVIKSMILGWAIGTIMGIVMFPELDRRTQRNIKRAKKRAMCMANDTYDNIMGYMKWVLKLYLL